MQKQHISSYTYTDKLHKSTNTTTKPPRKKDAPISSPAIGCILHSMELYHIKTTEIIVSDFLCFDFLKIATSPIKIQKSQDILPLRFLESDKIHI